ncbi:MAG: SLC13 family permease, partial [Anaerolinea sp.]|nr:SLC13 family permease [Anaerolinea sp.]
LIVCWVVIVLLYRDEFRGTLPAVELPPPRPFTPLLNRTLAIVVGLLIAFLLGAPIVTAASFAAALLLLSRLRPARLLALDWDLLAFFAGLFAITGAVRATGISDALFTAAQPILSAGIPGLSAVTAVLSNLISNVPAVLLLQTTIPALPDAQTAWLTLAMASTLAGNFTLLGSAATLIVAEIAASKGEDLSFMAFLKAGVPITLLTLAIGVIWLMLVG